VQTKFGQYKKPFWAKGPNLGGEVIVSVQWSLKLLAIKAVVPRIVRNSIRDCE